MRILGVIPARGGSKGLPRKNVLPLAGVPLMAWSIRAARGSGVLARVVVSTDDDEIAAVAKEHGGEVPFMRPADLATDTATSMAVVKHALGVVEELERAANGAAFREYDAVCLLQPTSPFRAPHDIVNAVRLLESSGAPSVISVSPLEHPLAWTAMLGADGRLELPLLRGLPNANASQGHHETQRQAHAAAYRLNGAVYVYRREVVLTHPTGLLPDTRAFVMGELDGVKNALPATVRGLDIDTIWDLNLANAMVLATSKAD